MNEVHEIRSLLEQLEKLCNKYFAKKYMTNDDVCRYLKISKRTLQNYRDKHYLRYIQIKNVILYLPKDIDEFLMKYYISETNDVNKRTYIKKK